MVTGYEGTISVFESFELRSILSRDTRFKPGGGKNGYWSLKTHTSPESPESISETDETQSVNGDGR